MKNKITLNKAIANLPEFLKNTKYDDITILTKKVHGSWDTVQDVVEGTGFEVFRFHNDEYVQMHEFSECYKFVRTTKGVK